jgi:lysine-N-methylase
MTTIKLHPTRTYEALLPRYVTRFSCIGPSCEDNCCTGWRVAIDKKTFNAYRQSGQPVLAKRFSKDVKRQRSLASDLNYAKIELNSDTLECPFLEDRLCAIQRELGEDKLSHACFNFPRYSRQFGDQFEQSLTLSCPEAATQALLAADAFDFVQGPISVRLATVLATPAKQGMSLAVMSEVRIFCLQLVRTPGVELWKRLAVLGVFCDALTSMMARGGHAEVPSMLQDFIALVEGGQAFGTVAEVRPDHTSQATAFVINFLNRSTRKVHAAQDKVRQTIARGLGIDVDAGTVDVNQLTVNYKNGLNRLAQVLEGMPFFLEHYLLNEMFRKLFPFSSASAYEDYLNLVSRFGILRLMLAAQCNAAEVQPDAPALVQTVQIFCRLLDHDKKFQMQANAVQTLYEWNKLENVYRFLPA